MNSCVLVAEIIQDPQLRYTQDNQTAIAEMLVQFPGLRPEDPMSTLKVVGWGNLAQDIQKSYHQGDRVLIRGELNINTVERPEGFREKRAELRAEGIYPLSQGAMAAPYGSEGQDMSEEFPSRAMPSEAIAPTPLPSPVVAPPAPSPVSAPTDDDIPF